MVGVRTCLQLLYSHLSSCKEEGREHARQKFRHLAANSIAFELGVANPQGLSSVWCASGARSEQNKYVGVPDLKFFHPVNICPVMSSLCNPCNVIQPAPSPSKSVSSRRWCSPVALSLHYSARRPSHSWLCLPVVQPFMSRL